LAAARGGIKSRSRLAALYPCGTAAAAAVAGHQLAKLDIEGIALDHLPLVEAASAQALALVLFLQAGALEAYDITHRLLLDIRFAAKALFYSNSADILPILYGRD